MLCNVQIHCDELRARFLSQKKQLAELKTTFEALHNSFQDFQTELALYRDDPKIAEAAYIFSAAQSRFLDLICADPDDRDLYGLVSDLLIDIREDLAPKAVKIAWDKYKQYWNTHNMNRLARELNNSRGRIVRREDRKSLQEYKQMTTSDVKNALTTIALRRDEITPPMKISDEVVQQVVELHLLTAIPRSL